MTTDRTMEALKEYEGSQKQLQDEIERIIISRSYSKRIEGYTLEMAIQIMDSVRQRSAALTPSPPAQEESALAALRGLDTFLDFSEPLQGGCLIIEPSTELDEAFASASAALAVTPQEGGIAEVEDETRKALGKAMFNDCNASGYEHWVDTTLVRLTTDGYIIVKRDRPGVFERPGGLVSKLYQIAEEFTPETDRRLTIEKAGAELSRLSAQKRILAAKVAELEKGLEWYADDGPNDEKFYVVDSKNERIAEKSLFTSRAKESLRRARALSDTE